MSDKPAFPVTAGNQFFTTGMTLRDWFAGQALVNLADRAGSMAFDPKGAASIAYEFADAMLAEREKPND